MTVLREFGTWRATDLEPEALSSIKTVSTNLKTDLGLRESPLIARVVGGQVQMRARHVAGFLHVGEQVIEIAPKFLFSDGAPHWRDAFLSILAHVG
jgi:hypothetical protein